MQEPTSRMNLFRSKRRLFLSYAREDHETVANLYRRLKTAGYQPWMDTESIPGGADWARQIEVAIRGSDYFLACLSSQSIEEKMVLQEEIRTALDIWRGKPDSDLYLIPVRLEKCYIPSSLAKLQWVDLFALDGWEKLLRALRHGQRRWLRWAAGLLVAVLVGLGILWATGRWRSTEASEFVSMRPGGRTRAPQPAAVLVGVTAWELRSSIPTDPPRSRAIIHPPPTAAQTRSEPEEYTPVRIPLEGALRAGSKFWLGIECSRSGYLYIVDRELSKAGQLGDPVLVFPTGRIRGGNNRISGGDLIRLPGEGADPPYWKLEGRGDYRGELVTVILAPQPLPELQARPEQAPIDGGWLAAFEKTWRAPMSEIFRGEPGGFAAPAELIPSPVLGQSDPPPQDIYRVDAKPGRPVVMSFPITVKQ